MADQDVEENESFLALFNKVFESMNVPPTANEEIENRIEGFKSHFNVHRKAAGACSPDKFNEEADFLGCFYWHSPISSAVTRYKALQAIRDIPAFESRFNQDLVNVVSVGGGSGSDLVGLYSALSATAAFGSMNVTLIDNVDWRKYFDEIHKSLSEGAFGNASQVLQKRAIHTSFILADMTNMTPECKVAIKGADVVWMKGFLSTLATDWNRYRVTKEIISSMTPGSLLVIMDSPAYDQFGYFVESPEQISIPDSSTDTPRPLVRLYGTDDGFSLQLRSQSLHHIIRTTNHEIIMFQKKF